jgi:hypothetical protein
MTFRMGAPIWPPVPPTLGSAIDLHGGLDGPQAPNARQRRREAATLLEEAVIQ